MLEGRLKTVGASKSATSFPLCTLGRMSTAPRKPFCYLLATVGPPLAFAEAHEGVGRDWRRCECLKEAKAVSERREGDMDVGQETNHIHYWL